MLLLWIYLACINAIGFAAMLWDKRQSRRQAPRIRERTLLLTSLIGGSLGILAGSRVARHKTRKQPLASLIWLIPLMQIITCALAWRAGWSSFLTT